MSTLDPPALAWYLVHSGIPARDVGRRMGVPVARVFSLLEDQAQVVARLEALESVRLARDGDEKHRAVYLAANPKTPKPPKPPKPPIAPGRPRRQAFGRYAVSRRHAGRLPPRSADVATLRTAVMEHAG